MTQATRGTLLALLAAALFACVWSGVEETVIETPSGVAVVDSYTTTATVTSVDLAKRELELKLSDGRKKRYKASKEVVNLDRVRVGDQVRAVLVDEVAVTLIKGGAAPSVGTAASVALAPKGAKPGVVMTDTVEVTAEIVSLDRKKRRVTFEFVDGSAQTVKIARDLDLTQVQVGDSVRVQVTEAVAISVEAP